MTQTFALLALAVGFVVAPVMPVWATSTMADGHEFPDYSAARIVSAATGKLIWMPETVEVLPAKSRDDIDGTQMTFAGLRMEENRANQIANLATIAASED